MKGIILILVYTFVWLPTNPNLYATGSAGQEPSKQDKQHQVIIDEILQACGPLFFEYNSAEITAEDEKCLLEISLTLQMADNYYLVVDVHKTSSESEKVSTARVERVHRYLREQKKIDSDRLIIRDFKDSCPHEAEKADFNARLEFWYWREKE